VLKKVYRPWRYYIKNKKMWEIDKYQDWSLNPKPGAITVFWYPGALVLYLFQEGRLYISD